MSYLEQEECLARREAALLIIIVIIIVVVIPFSVEPHGYRIYSYEIRTDRFRIFKSHIGCVRGTECELCFFSFFFKDVNLDKVQAFCSKAINHCNILTRKIILRLVYKISKMFRMFLGLHTTTHSSSVWTYETL